MLNLHIKRLVIFYCTILAFFNLKAESFLDNEENKKITLEALQSIFKNVSYLDHNYVHNWNQSDRDVWVKSKAATIQPDSKVLDIGAGTCLYRTLFSHCNYVTQDFTQNTNHVKYGKIDIVSDVTSIPLDDNSFDVIISTEVLEHVPEPILALKEMARILKPGGKMFLTAPLGSGLHQLPFHFYGGYIPEWYKHFCAKFGLKIIEISPNGRFFKMLAQECARVSWIFDKHKHLYDKNQATFIYWLFNEFLPKYLVDLDGKCFHDQFTIGYHVEAIKL